MFSKTTSDVTEPAPTPEDGPAQKEAAVYKRIEKHLRGRIAQGEWGVGSMLPSRRALAQKYGVSSLTVERAITRLVEDGLLRSDDRRGTFVMAPAPDMPPVAPLAETSLPVARPPSQDNVPLTIGVIAPLYVHRHDHLELNNFWVRLMVGSLEQSFSEDGHLTHFFNQFQGPNKPVQPLDETITMAIDAGVDALAVIAFGMEAGDVDDALHVLNGKHVPLVCITSDALRRPAPHVFYDSYGAGYQAAQHLLRCGAREILYLAPFSASWVQKRLEGIIAAAGHFGLASEAVRVIPEAASPWVQEEDPETLGYAAAAALFASGWSATGVLCANDGVAFGLLRAAAEHGKAAGRDFALISFDDHPQSRALRLTSLRPPMEALGREAGRLLHQSIQGELIGLQVRLRGHLIPRASTQGLLPAPQTKKYRPKTTERRKKKCRPKTALI